MEFSLFFATSSRPDLGTTQLPTEWTSGSFTPGVKRPGREADHAPPYYAEVKNAWSYTSTAHFVFMAWH